MDNDIRSEIIAKSPISYSSLRKLNIWAGIFLLIQGIIMVALGYILDWKQAIYTFYLKFKIISLFPPSFQIQPDPTVAFTISHLGIILSSFLFISAIALLTIAFLKNKTYVENLKKGMNVIFLLYSINILVFKLITVNEYFVSAVVGGILLVVVLL